MRPIIHIVDILERQSHTVKSVCDGVALLEELKSDGYDILITDICMPALNGISASNIATKALGLNKCECIPLPQP